MNKTKYAFGIFQDGLNIKVAQLVKENGEIKVQKLEETTLSYPLYVKTDKDMVEMYQAQADDTWDTSFEDVMDNISKIQEEEAATSKGELQNLLSKFPLQKGKISLNVDDEQITYYKFDSKVSVNKMYKTLKKKYIPADELEAKDYCLAYINKDENSNLAIVQHGENYLLNAIMEIRKQIGAKKKFNFAHVNTNEVSLMNILESNYEFQNNEFVLLVYVGLDYKVGIVMKGKQHFKTFPIIVNSSDPEKVRKAVLSNIMLQQDILNVPISQHVILAGEETFVNQETYNFFKEKIQQKESLERLTLHNIKIDDNYKDEVTDDKIAKYAIPISLAWKTLIPQETKFKYSNLLPHSILESQKFHKIAWHGYLILLVIFGFALISTINYLEFKKKLEKSQYETDETEKQLTAIQMEYNQLQNKVSKLRENQQKPTDIELSLQKIIELDENKKNWHFILKILADKIQKYPISWITNLTPHEEGFNIKAYTTEKRNILKFADIFPNSFIHRINRQTLQGIEVWQFDISYGFPKEIKKPQERVTEKININKNKKPNSTLHNAEIYEIQLLAANNMEKVNELAQKFQKSNIPTKITEKPVKNGIIYRLRLKDSYSFEQAKATAADLKAKFPELNDVWIDKITMECEDNALENYNKAVDLYFSGKIEKSILALDNFLIKHPQHYLSANVRYLKGECFYKLNDFENAKNIFLETIENNEFKKPDALKMIGKIELQQGNYNLARKYWKMFLLEYPNHYLQKDVEKLLQRLEK